VSLYSTSNVLDTTDRLSLVHPLGQCTPTHISLAVPTNLTAGSGDYTTAGSVGVTDSTGVFTTVSVVDLGLDSSPEYFADYWRDYRNNSNLIHAHAQSNLRANADLFPPSQTYCADDTFGCRDHCSRSFACHEREQQGGECVVVAIASYQSTYGYIESLLSNLGVPAYFCFVGHDTLEEFAVAMNASGDKGALVYLSVRDPLFLRYPGLLQRVLLPRMASADTDIFDSAVYFGENGYDAPSNRTFAIVGEKPEDVLQKVASAVLEQDASNQPASQLLSQFRVTDVHLNGMLVQYVSLTNESSSSSDSDDLHFAAACAWVRDNYSAWKTWLEPLPECTIDHMDYNISGCDGPYREIGFKWKVPDPTNESLPYVCDGGFLVIPSTVILSAPCEMIESFPGSWMSRLRGSPPCQPPDSTIMGLDCLTNGKRPIQFVWKLPDPTNASLSLECDSSQPQSALRDPMYADCEYMPTNAGAFIAVAVITCIVMAIIVAAMGLIFKHRNVPIIRRSQFEFLEVMLVGALFICTAVLLFAGEPTDILCATRPTIVALGFTMIFGSLIVKSLRVYRVFMSKNMKRIVLPTATMFKILAAFLLVDVLVLLVWFVVDFPAAKQVQHTLPDLPPFETVSATECTSTSFIFSAILMFWKAVLLGTGLYLSFLIRNVSVDFQESIWIFASSVVVGFACVLLLPLAFLVDLPATTLYLFIAFVLLLCTLMVVGMMLVPKFLRQKEAPSTTTNGSTIGSSHTRTSEPPEDTKSVGAQSSPGKWTAYRIAPRK
jgi:gamma-aminobutyric acid type B receptor